MSSRRKANFNENERLFLLEILKKYSHIIENKKSDNVSSSAKKSAWTKIAEQFNSSAIIVESVTIPKTQHIYGEGIVSVP